MNRAQYLADRRRIRAARLTRAERGLPHHPDGSGLAPCPRCGSDGCSLCDGTTFVTDGHRDPLLRLRYVRQSRIRRRNPAAYVHVRQICATPSWRLPLIDAVVGCELALRGSLTAWRAVA